MWRGAAIVASLAALAGFAIHLSLPVLSCPESCLLDYVAMHGSEVGNFELPDARLNAWILGWVQHAGLSEPSSLFDTNAFHPARNTLANSEHMIGNALLLLPVRLFTDSAIALHQIALVLTFSLLGWTTFAFVRWAGQSNWAALLAGIAAMYMPWRYSELGHLQLLSAQWIPLIWLLSGRLLLGEGTRRDAIALSAVLGLQMLTSFYLAYFALFSTGCFAAAAAWRARPTMNDWLRLATAVAVPSLALVALAMPYVSRFSAFHPANPTMIPQSTPPGIVLDFLAPSLTLLADRDRLADVAYYIPLVVFCLACVPLLRHTRLLRPLQSTEPLERRLDAVVLGLFMAVSGAFVLMLGRKLAIGDLDIPILSTLFAKILPGFSQMRAEFRWGIVIGIAFPILAGLGIALIDRTSSVRRSPWLRIGTNAAIAATLALNTPFFQLAVKPAWHGASEIQTAHQKLAELPPGPTLELPWGFRRIHIASFGSRYMLASSLHWNPLLNGYTAYLPASHAFLQRLAQFLPEPETIRRLQRLTGLRWIVLHPKRFAPWELERWNDTVRRQTLALEYADAGTRIYAVPEYDDAGSLQSAIALRASRPRTLSGLSRDPIDVARAVGRMRIVAPDRMRYEQGTGSESWVALYVSNDSDQIWAGYDIDSEGLVELRYRFFDTEGAEVHVQTAALDVDVPPHQQVRTQSIVRAPARDGHFRIVFDLVQRIGDDLRPLAVPAVTREVDVEPALSPSSRMRDELRRRSADPTRTREHPDPTADTVHQ